MSWKVDVNCDMGESLGAYRIGRDEEVIKYITSANVACGFHASDPTVMRRTVDLCRKYGVVVGAHPGYPDILGFGRRSMDVGEEDLANYIIYQVGALKGFLALHGMELHHVKFHGALYNRFPKEEGLFAGIADSLVKAFGDVMIMTLGSTRASVLKKKCAVKGIRIALEAFPDRQYTDEGSLLPRMFENAVVRDPTLIAERALRMVTEGGIESVNGRWIEMGVDTICIHGDNERGIEAARMIRTMADQRGVEIAPLGGAR